MHSFACWAGRGGVCPSHCDCKCHIRNDGWQAGYDDAHNEIDPSDNEHKTMSFLWAIDYKDGRAVHDSFCGDH